ncbi:MAG: hypothetical protein HJJLKODD_02457 [Phycisphaerae bacterium]|nr:hypothetical protein [Phycisphaerae bacterium]
MKSDVVNIVSGLPRSGTSMMMRMLEAGGVPVLIDNIRVADQDNPNGYYEFEPVKKTKEDASWLAGAGGRVVKMVYMLLYDLPKDHSYRVVFMRRHLREVIKSQEVMLEHKGKQRGDLPEEKLLALFESQLNQFYQWIERQPHFKILYVNYNEILQDARPAVQSMSEFFGNELDTQAMLNVVDPNLYRQKM